MAAAKLVSDVEQSDADWIVIKDEDGQTYCYFKTAMAGAEPTHIRANGLSGVVIKATLETDAEGRPFLHQDGPGLPKFINVFYVSPFAGSVGVGTGWSGLLQYVLVL